jgi:hypothetical protein
MKRKKLVFIHVQAGGDNDGCTDCSDGSCGDSSHDTSGPDYDGDV